MKIYNTEDILVEKLIPSGLKINKSQFNTLEKQLTIINILRFLLCVIIFSTPLSAVLAYVISGIIIRGIYQDKENYLYAQSFIIGLNKDILSGLKKVKKE